MRCVLICLRIYHPLLLYISPITTSVPLFASLLSTSFPYLSFRYHTIRRLDLKNPHPHPLKGQDNKVNLEALDIITLPVIFQEDVDRRPSEEYH